MVSADRLDSPVGRTPEGWLGRLELKLAVSDERTILSEKRQVGPLTVQRAFYPEGGVCHLYLLHPPGGVVGGDRLEIELHTGAGCQALITAPGAAKLYRSSGAISVAEQRIKVASGAQLEWLPLENIFFSGARVCIDTAVELASDARFIGWEIHSLGRPAIGERFTTGMAKLRFSLYRDGKPLLRDRLQVIEGRGLDGSSGLRGFPIVATFVSTDAVQADLDLARSAMAAPQRDLLLGLTLIGDLLVGRCLAADLESVNRTFRKLWGILRPRILKRGACAPRIWST